MSVKSSKQEVYLSETETEKEVKSGNDNWFYKGLAIFIALIIIFSMMLGKCS